MIFLKSYFLENNRSHFYSKAADVDDDGTVSSTDIVELSMYLLDQIGSFSSEKNIDSDKDGLCDYIEKEVLRTDPFKSDTDGDGLNDYSEIYFCDTDPLSVDTGNTGKKDCDRDADSDKLTNLEEVLLGTSPGLSDTDEDGLSDYDEVKKYKTDPLKEDTDGDKISDFGEIKLELDPLKRKSDGSNADKDVIFEQQLDEKSEVLSFVNQQNYALSINTKSSGYLAENIDVSVSRYTNFLGTDVIYGDIIDVEFDNNFSLDEINLNFCLNNCLYPENYAIFKYSEELNMIFPVETFYEGNNLTVSDDSDGTYCVVDISKWIESLEAIQPDPTPAPPAIGNVESSSNMDLEVYFLVYLKSDYLETGRQSIIKASKSIIDFCNSINRNIKIYYVSYMGNFVGSRETYNDYISNSTSDDEIESMVKRIGKVSMSADSKNYELKQKYSFENAIGKNLFDVSMQKTFTNKYLFIVDGDTEPNVGKIKDENNVINKMKSNGVFVSIICNKDNKRTQEYEKLSSDNICYELTDDFSNVIEERVLNDKTYGFSAAFNIETGFCNEIEYDIDQITEEWKTVFLDYMSGELTVDDIKKMGFPDTDSDGTPDCLEINFGYISFDENGKIILPTYGSLAKAYGKGYGAFVSKMSSLGYNIDYIKVLPLFSYPTIDDSDYDGLEDKIDAEPTKEDIIKVNDSILDDSSVFDINYHSQVNTVVEGNGTVYCHSEEKKNNVIEYSRDKNIKGVAVSHFYLNPEYNSDYLITAVVGKNDDFDIEIYYEKLIGKCKVSEIVLEGVTTEQDENIYGNSVHIRKAYSLEKGKKYHIIIKIKSKSFGLYSISFEQDNWVYAPNGGVKQNKVNILGDYDKEIYIPYNVMEQTITYISSDYNQEFKIEDLYDLEYCISKLGITETNEYKLRLSVGTGATIIGGIIAVLPDGMIISLIGRTASVIGLASLTDIFDKNEIEIQSIDLNLVYDQKRHNVLGLDYLLSENRTTWNSNKYISKYFNRRERADIQTDIDYLEIARACKWVE